MQDSVEVPSSVRRKVSILKKNKALTPSDEKLIAYLFSNLRQVIHMTAGQFSGACGVSVAAVTRLTHKLGYDRFPDLKMALLGEVSRQQELHYSSIHPLDSAEERMRKVIYFDKQSISDIEEALDVEQLQRAVKILGDAKHVTFVGLGGSASVAYDCYHKFMRTGMSTELLEDNHRFRIRCTAGAAGDAVVVFSSEGRDGILNQSLRIARERGVSVIAVTMFSHSPMIENADVCLFTLSGESGGNTEALISRVASYVVVDVLYMEYYSQHAQEIESLQKRITRDMRDLKSDQ